MTEDEYKERLVSLLSGEFELIPEARGSWPTGRRVYLDFLCKPKRLAREQGFPVETFGIEVKSPDVGRNPEKKLLDAVIQAYTYTLCEFSDRQPGFVLIYPEIRTFFRAGSRTGYRGDHNPLEEPDVDILRRIGQRANVGEIVENKYDRGYQFRFGRDRMYSPERGVSRVLNFGLKRQIGSRQI